MSADTDTDAGPVDLLVRGFVHGLRGEAGLMELSFLALEVIPEYRLTNKASWTSRRSTTSTSSSSSDGHGLDAWRTDSGHASAFSPVRLRVPEALTR